MTKIELYNKIVELEKVNVKGVKVEMILLQGLVFEYPPCCIYEFARYRCTGIFRPTRKKLHQTSRHVMCQSCLDYNN